MIPRNYTSDAARSVPIRVGIDHLTIEDVERVARESQRPSSLAPEVIARVQATAEWVASTVEQIARKGRTSRKPVAYYGINTGFGAQAGRSALDSKYLTEVLGRNLIASHSVGVGPYFDEAVVRAAVLIRAQSLAQGYSGVRPVIIETLLRVLNEGVYPAIPEQGSLGASGDLAPLAHLLLVLFRGPTAPASEVDLQLDTTDGEAFVPARLDAAVLPGGIAKAQAAEGDCISDACGFAERAPAVYLHITEDYATGAQKLWRRVGGAEAMAAVGGKIELRAKEALALINGSTFSAAIAALVVCDAQNLLDHAELAVAMTLEGIRGFRDPFYPHLHRARGHMGAEHTAARVLRYVEGSQLLDPGDLRTNPERIPPQDPYSVRCAPQVLGTVADTLDLARRWVEMEVNAATDNPLIFLELPRDYKTMSGGNFHGEPIAMAMDFLGIAFTDLGNLSDRRMFLLTNYSSSPTRADTAGPSAQGPELSPFLVDEPNGTRGLNSGLMMLQATAAALVSDCKALAHPDSIDSIPSSGNQEDHVSMSLNAARHAREIVKNVEHVLALEFLCAAQAIALQLRKPGKRDSRPGAGTGAAYQLMRGAGIAPVTQDRVLYPDIRKAIHLLRSGSLVRAAREAVGEVSRC
jgi:histidine ammonia-lyase